MTSRQEGVAIGVDLGGTGTRFVALDPLGSVVADGSAPTPAQASQDEALGFLWSGIRSVAASTRIRSIGIGASGPIDAEGVIRNADTLPAFSGWEVVAGLQRLSGVPVSIDNDAVTAAIFEAALGAGRGRPSILMVTLGTGVGVAAVVGGEPVRGADGAHPEAGHLGISGREAPCYCGRAACWEQVASRSALQRSASALLALPSGGPDDIQLALQRGEDGDPAAQTLFDSYGRGVADGLADLLTVFRSSLVVLGGSGATYADGFMPALRARLAELSTYAADVDVAVTHAGDLGGAIGAALLGSRLSGE